MTDTAVSSASFEKLKSVILSRKEKAIVDKSGDSLTMTFSSLVYSLTSEKEEAIHFNALELDFVIKPSGELMLIEVEGDTVDFYTVNEDIKSSLYSYLDWRTNVLANTGV